MIETIGNIFGSLSERMRLTPQDVRWHGEGDVLTHTRMVCEALGALPQYAELPGRQREILMAAAMLHDVGKVVVRRSGAEQPRPRTMPRSGPEWHASGCGSAG